MIMKSCLSIYLGTELQAINMTHSDVWTKGCICPGCYDHIYLVEKGNSKFIAHCPRQPEYKLICNYRSAYKISSKEIMKGAKRDTHRTVERFHRYFSGAINSFIVDADIYEHRKGCLDFLHGDKRLGSISNIWKNNLTKINQHTLQIMTQIKNNEIPSLNKKEMAIVKELFYKAHHNSKHTMSVLCIIKYLCQDRAKIHLEALFLYCNYLAYCSYHTGVGTSFYNDWELNIKSTLLYMLGVIVFCPWLKIVECLEQGQSTEQYTTKVIPYVEASTESLEYAFKI